MRTMDKRGDRIRERGWKTGASVMRIVNVPVRLLISTLVVISLLASMMQSAYAWGAPHGDMSQKAGEYMDIDSEYGLVMNDQGNSVTPSVYIGQYAGDINYYDNLYDWEKDRMITVIHSNPTWALYILDQFRDVHSLTDEQMVAAYHGLRHSDLRDVDALDYVAGQFNLNEYPNSQSVLCNHAPEVGEHCVEQSKAYFASGDEANGWKYLAYSLHYVEDCSCPAHTSVVGLANYQTPWDMNRLNDENNNLHHTYEKYVDVNWESGITGANTGNTGDYNWYPPKKNYLTWSGSGYPITGYDFKTILGEFSISAPYTTYPIDTPLRQSLDYSTNIHDPGYYYSVKSTPAKNIEAMSAFSCLSAYYINAQMETNPNWERDWGVQYLTDKCVEEGVKYNMGFIEYATGD